jgi:hypothetical protein
MKAISIISFAVLAAIGILGCSREADVGPCLDHSSTEGPLHSPGMLWLIHQGVCDGELAYVVFVGAHGDIVRSVVTAGGTTSGGKQWHYAELKRPDGTVVQLPAKVQLMEVIDGRYGQSDRRVTLAELEAFIKSGPAGPDGFTSDNLLRFVDARRAAR